LKLLKNFIWNKGETVFGSAVAGADAQLLAELSQASPSGLLHIAEDDTRLAFLQTAIRFFAPRLEQIALPAWDCLPYDRVSPNAEILSRRMQALARLAAGGKAPFILLTTVNAALQRLPPRENLLQLAFHAEVGAKIDRQALQDYLVAAGYNRVATVLEPGEFAVRGGLIDLFPPGSDEPIRLDLFGDELEGIRAFDPVSQISHAQVRAVSLLPASEVIMQPDAINRFRAGYRAEFGGASGDDPLYQAISEGRKHPGLEHWMPLFYSRMETLFDFLPNVPLTLDRNADLAAGERLSTIGEYYAARRDVMESSAGKALGGTWEGAAYKPLSADRLYLTAAEWQTKSSARPLGRLEPFPQAERPTAAGDRVASLDARRGRNFAPERGRGEDVFAALQSHIRELQGRPSQMGTARGGPARVLISAFTQGSRERLRHLLADHLTQDGETASMAEVADYAELLALPPTVVGLGLTGLSEGVESTDLAIITEEDILGERLIRPHRRPRQAEAFLADVAALHPGDLVVHIDHGIGRFQRLETIDVGRAPHDCLLLLYDGGDRLYLPVENIEMLSRFGSEETEMALDKLGSSAWQNRKARLKNRLKLMAEELIKIAAERSLHQSPNLITPEGPFEEFCARFPYEETADQESAIQQTLDDMASGRPMDRLICGDVGFGKTEIALRAAFVTAFCGRQVALLCPTTLLARQHYATFTERFRQLPVRIAQMSRLVAPAVAAQVRQGLADGHVDIVIGTHALLAKGVQFKNLGLAIVDEEQRFGVRHKEQLKHLRTEVHVLTLTATPIPRTLQLALSGVRELSVIASPPVDRLSIRTFIMPFDPIVIREALRREFGRGGQAFLVVPRIRDLPEALAFLETHLPEAKAVIAHGQMPAKALEAAMTAFYEQRAQLLISTEIIESGLDIPTANTLVIFHADRFGLAQLYQLRGRIGRSKLRAYAYITTAAGRTLGTQADRRLKVLQSLDSLGAGFNLASHDLDIRGAGNLLGEEQSGHIREVGIELYQELLEEAVQTARGRGVAAADKWSPQIALGTPVLIPESYVGDLSVRMQLYRRLADLVRAPEIDSFAAELIDRFGPLPDELKHILQLVTVKRQCREAGVEKVEAGPKGVTLSFRKNRFADPAGLVAYLSNASRTGVQAKLRPDHRLVVMRDWPDEAERVAGVGALLHDLAKIATAAGAAPA
jgi:transcription-repair coupling factor (superfamily II helicase)